MHINIYWEQCCIKFFSTQQYKEHTVSLIYCSVAAILGVHQGSSLLAFSLGEPHQGALTWPPPARLAGEGEAETQRSRSSEGRAGRSSTSEDLGVGEPFQSKVMGREPAAGRAIADGQDGSSQWQVGMDNTEREAALVIVIQTLCALWISSVSPGRWYVRDGCRPPKT